jgi:hypothetical protein
MIRKIAFVTAVVGSLAALGATSAHAVDAGIQQDGGYPQTPTTPQVISQGFYFERGQGVVLWDLYKLPNGQEQMLCRAPSSKETKVCR